MKVLYDAKPDDKVFGKKVLGAYEIGPKGEVVRGQVNLNKPGDYGADPLGNGKFRMVPSGDIVDFEERNRRLAKR